MLRLYYRFSLHPGRHFEKTPSLNYSHDIYQLIVTVTTSAFYADYGKKGRVEKHGHRKKKRRGPRSLDASYKKH
jgi:hypothetical protein